jgi:hypothetical protein
MVDLLYMPKVPSQIRLIAANYISRAKDINLSDHHNRISEIFNKENNPYIEMALANGIGKSKDTLMINALQSKLITSKDYRVKTNIIRAFEHMPYRLVRDALFTSSKDPNIHVSQVASSIFIKNGSAIDVPKYAAFDTITTPWQV